MILENVHQVGVTKERIAQLDEYVTYLRSSEFEPDPEVHPLLPAIEAKMLESLRLELLQQIADYENLRNGEPKSIQVNNLDELPTVLLKARIAAGLSQKELAEKLSLDVSEIKSFEDSNYGHASLACLSKVSEVLQVKFSGNLEFPSVLEQANATPESAKPVAVG